MNKKAEPKKRQKQLTLNKINKQYKDLSKWSSYTLNDEENLVIKYKEKFDKLEVENLLQEAYEKISYMQNEGASFPNGDDDFIRYLHFLIIKYFTEFGKSIPEDFESQLEIMKELIATGIFELLFAEVFNHNEVLSVIERAEKTAKIISDIGEIIKETQNTLNTTIKNKEVLNAFNSPTSSTTNVVHPLMNPYGAH